MNEKSLLEQKDIRSARLAKGIGLNELAHLAGVPRGELSKCERGLVLPSDKFFISVAKVLAVSPADLRLAHAALLETAVFGEGYATAIAKSNHRILRRSQLSGASIPVVDLFCGVGGFSHGFERAGYFQVSLGVDLLPDRIKTFSHNHPTATALCEDIRGINLNRLDEENPHPEVIIGGPPCQGFSSLRPFRTLTENDPRNNLFEYFAMTVNALRPKWFVLENVVGLLSHKDGATLRIIVDLFESIGYKTEWKVLNAAMYGLPQRRERLIVIGNSLGISFRWPTPTHFFYGRSMAGKRNGLQPGQLALFESSLPQAVTVMEAIHDLPELEAGESSDKYREDVTPTGFEKAMRGNEKVLTLHEATAHTPHMLEIIQQAGYNRNALPEGLTTSGFSTSYSRLEPDMPSVTLTVNFVHPASNKCIHPFQDRALTPREGARLQGFEDGFRFIGTRSQIVKQIGNAVPPILGEVIAHALLEHF